MAENGYGQNWKLCTTLKWQHCQHNFSFFFRDTFLVQILANSYLYGKSIFFRYILFSTSCSVISKCVSVSLASNKTFFKKKKRVWGWRRRVSVPNAEGEWMKPLFSGILEAYFQLYSFLRKKKVISVYLLRSITSCDIDKQVPVSKLVKTHEFSLRQMILHTMNLR